MKFRFLKAKNVSFLKPHCNGGFSLVEMIIYVAIFSIIFTVILNLFWRVQLSGSRLQIANEVTGNTYQVMQLATSAMREGDSLDTDNSVFGSHPGKLVINDAEVMTFDTYTKDVNVGGQLVSIRKLRLTQGVNPAADITSNHLDVTNFVLTNLSQGGSPDVVQIELELSNINPENDPDFENSISIRSSISSRKES